MAHRLRKSSPKTAPPPDMPVGGVPQAPIPAAEPLVVDATVAEPAAAIADPVAEIGASAAEDLGEEDLSEEDFGENVRKLAEDSGERARTAYDHMRAAAEDATGSFESSYTAATKGLNEFNAKAIDALKINTDATFDLLKALMGVTTLSEAITLQTEHVRKQFDTMTAQSKELAEIAKKVASETTEPLKAGVAKTLGKAA